MNRRLSSQCRWRTLSLHLFVLYILCAVGVTSVFAQTDYLTFEDGNGVFSMDYPSVFDQIESPSLAELMGAESNIILDEYGYLFLDGDNGIGIYFLLTDGTAYSDASWKIFSDALLANFTDLGFETLESESSSSAAHARLKSDQGDILDIHLKASGDLVAFWFCGAPEDVWDEVEPMVNASYESLSWSPENLSALFGDAGDTGDATSLIPYENPDGLFSFDVPVSLGDRQTLRYADISSNPLPKLDEDIVFAFVDEDDSDNAVGTIFLLHAVEISTEGEWRDFVGIFVENFFDGNFAVEMAEYAGEDDFFARVTGKSRDAWIIMDFQEVDGLVAVILSSAASDAPDDLARELNASMDSFQWSPDAVREWLTTKTEVALDELALTLKPVADPEGVLSLMLPTNLHFDDVGEDDGYGLIFSDPDSGQELVAGVRWARELLDDLGSLQHEGQILQPLTDDEWETLADLLRSEMFDGVPPQLFLTSRTDHSMLIGAADPDTGSETMVFWLEESNGIIALLSLNDEEGDIRTSRRIIETIVATFSWSPARAKEVLLAYMEDAPSADVGAPFADPLGVIQLPLPDFLRFNNVRYEEDGLFYSFSPDEGNGGLFFSFEDIGPPLSNEEWASVAADAKADLASLVQSRDADVEAVVESEFVEKENNTAAFEISGDRFHGLFELQESDGVLALTMMLTPVHLWPEPEAQLRVMMSEAVWDPETLLNAIGDELPATLLRGTLAAELNEAGEPVGIKRIFAPDAPIAFAAQFVEETLDGTLDLTIRAADQPPLAHFNIDVTEWTSYARDFQVMQNEDGMRAGFTLRPTEALTVGDYLVELRYNGAPLSIHGFTVAEPEPLTAALHNAGFSLQDGGATSYFTPYDPVQLNGTVELPAGAALRALWYAGDDLMIEATQTLRPLVDRRAGHFDFVHLPDGGWEPGTYRVVLTVNGTAGWEGGFTVLQSEKPAPLDAQGTDLLQALPLPEDAQIIPVVEGIDIGFTTGLLPDLIPSWMAWMRDQGWQRTLPITALATRHLRWTKDGHQFVLSVDDRDDDGRWRVFATHDMASGSRLPPLPSGEKLSMQSVAGLVEMARLAPSKNIVNRLAFSADGALLATSSTSGNLVVYNMADLTVAFHLIPDGGTVGQVAFSPDGRYLAASVLYGETAPFSPTIHVWRVDDWAQTHVLIGHANTITALTFSPDSSTLLSASMDTTIRVWPLDESQTAQVWRVDIPDVRQPAVQDIAFTASGSELVAAIYGGVAQVWSYDTGTLMYEFPIAGANNLRLAAVPSFDSPVAMAPPTLPDLVTVGGGQAQLWVLDIGEARYFAGLPEPEQAPVIGVGVSPDGSMLAEVGADIRIHAMDDGALLHVVRPLDEDGELRPLDQAWFDPSGVYLLIREESGALSLWALPVVELE